MAKRFTDTEKWKKGFIHELPPRLKLLWFYLLDECDIAGVWQVEWKVMEMRTGIEINQLLAIEKFAGKVHVFDEGKKWFIPDFITFQYGSLNEANRVHNSVLKKLKDYALGAYYAPYEGAKDKNKVKAKAKEGGVGETEPLETSFENYEEWTELILQQQDQFFEPLLQKDGVKFSPEAIKDHLSLVARYNWKFTSQQKFRNSVIKHIIEFEKKKVAGAGKFQSTPTDPVYKAPGINQPEQKDSLAEVALEEKNRRARQELKNEIESDVVLFSENESCRLKIPAVKMEILLEEETVEIADEEKRVYFNQAREDRMKELNANYDPATKIILHHYRDGKTPDSELGLLRTMAREIAYRSYLKKRVEENSEKLYSVQPAPENIV